MDAEIIKGVKEKEKVISFSLPFDDLNVHESSLVLFRRSRSVIGWK